MKICCGSCHVLLKDADIVVMDILNGLCHYTCLGLHPDLIKEIGEYKMIKAKYEFFQEKIIH